MDDELQSRYVIELHHLIDTQQDISCKDALAFIEKDAGILGICFTDSTTRGFPLNYAIYRNNLGVTEAILKIFTEEKYAGARNYIQKVMNCDPHFKKEFNPLDNFLYTTSKLGSSDIQYLPDALATSAEMLQLLHTYGYDFHKHTWSGKEQYLHLGRDLVDLIANEKIDFNNLSAPFWRAARELAIDQKEPSYTIDGLPNSIGIQANFPTYLFAETTQFYKNSKLKPLRDKLFEKCAQAGFDFREMLGQDFKSYPPCMGNESIVKRFQEAAKSLSHYCNILTGLYFTQPKENRVYCAFAACSGGLFPDLLTECLVRDKSEGGNHVSELLSCLDDYWKNEYRNLINATLNRTAPLKETSGSKLELYARNASSAIGGLSV